MLFGELFNNMLIVTENFTTVEELQWEITAVWQKFSCFISKSINGIISWNFCLQLMADTLNNLFEILCNVSDSCVMLLNNLQFEWIKC